MVHSRAFRSKRLMPHALSILLVTLVLFAPAGAGIARAADNSLPPQPTGLTAVHRAGQTFLTWQERGDLAGEHYRIYRHTAPITSANLAAATLLYEVAEGSAIFFANRYADYASPPGWHVRYAERYIIDDLGPQVASGTGLLVWTLAPSEAVAGASAYYAVTTVAGSAENTTHFSSANAIGPVAGEGAGRPQPIRIRGQSSGWQIYLQFMDLHTWNPTFHAPNPLNGYYGLAATSPGVPGALQYAYDYALYVPDAARCGGALPASLPVFLSLHAWGDNHYGPLTGAVGPWCAYILAPVDQSETWWFGFARDHDYRTSGAPGPGDAIVNYTEQRVLQMIDFLLRAPPGPPADPERIYVSGHSMGGGGAVALALRYPQVFSAANASKPVTDHRTGGWTFSTVPRWGPIALNLPVLVDAPDGWADPLQPYAKVGVWDWQNLQADLVSRPGQSRAPVNADFGIDDTAVPWTAQGAPFLLSLEASRQAWAASVGSDGHSWGAYRGLAPDYGLDAQGVPFAGLAAVRDESLPGFSGAEADPPIPPQVVGTFHHTLFWSSSWQAWDGAPVDTPQQWQASICAVGAGSATPRCGSGILQHANVTPRRLQAFQVAPGQPYYWENWSIATGALIAGGVVTADTAGTVTVPGFEISPSGNRLVLLPAPPPAALTSFTATRDAEAVHLGWQTSSENGAVAFNVLRAAAIDGPYVRANAVPIPAAGAPASYVYTDNPGRGTAFYRLEDVDAGSSSRTHGPLKVTIPFTRFLPSIAPR